MPRRQRGHLSTSWEQCVQHTTCEHGRKTVFRLLSKQTQHKRVSSAVLFALH
jgi:hypothetical protein